MKNSKFITSSLLAVFAIALCSVLFTSSTTVEQSNSQVITQLSAELSDLKQDLTTLKVAVDDEAVAAEPLMGEIIMFAGNFAPRGWQFCSTVIAYFTT